MQQRRLRLGDIVDDYCPRERRITNHAIVALVENEVKQTRCTTCDADHEYKQARVPPQRRRKDSPSALQSEVPAAVPRKRTTVEEPAEEIQAQVHAEPFDGDVDDETQGAVEETPIELPASTEPPAETLQAGPAETPRPGEELTASDDDAPIEDDGPVHRPLIRATLPRPEGQVPERKAPDFTIRQRGDNNGGRQNRGPRRPQGQQGNGMGQPSRFGGHGGPSRPGSGQPRHGSGQPPRHGSGQPPRHGSGQPHGPGNRQGPGSRPGHGPADQQRHGRRGGRKRGR